MTDEPSDKPSGDAEFQRWFAEQDPFGNTKAKPQAPEAKTAQKNAPTDKPSGKPLDTPSGELSGDAGFERWFAEQDPFGNAKAGQNTPEAKTTQKKRPASGLLRFGIALPIFFLILAVLTLAFFTGVALRSFH